MWNSKFIKACVSILLVLLIIYVGSLVSFVFRPLVVAFEALFISFLIAGLLFYLTVPLAAWLQKLGAPRPVSIGAVFAALTAVVILFAITIGPILQREFTALILGIPEKADQVRSLVETLQQTDFWSRLVDPSSFNIDSLTENLSQTLTSTAAQLAFSVAAIIDFLAGLFITIVIVPFILYAMLKEQGGSLLPGLADRFAPEEYRETVKKALAEMNRLLASYVQGLGLVCLCVGILAYVGFLLIGLQYALIISLFIMITNIVPFLGPFIGAIPAAIVGLLDSPLTMLKVIIVIVVVQQIESLLISPQVMGKKLALNPLAIILIVLVAGRLGGLLGIILAIPTFTVLKIVAAHVYEQVQLSRSRQ